MTQSQLIDAIESLLPSIVKSKDPESVLLKYAEANNLCPEQLERLGQCYNQAKTLTALKKQANRGDSFIILDVPKLKSSYTTYDPDAALSRNEKKEHNKVNDLISKAGSDYDAMTWCLNEGNDVEVIPLNKVASALRVIPAVSIYAALTSDDDEDEKKKSDDEDEDEEVADGKDTIEDVGDFKIVYKKATASYYDAAHKLDRERREAQRCYIDAYQDMMDKCASISKTVLYAGPDAWKEIVADAVTDLSKEAAANAISICEEYMIEDRVSFSAFDMTKDAGMLHLTARDKYNSLQLMKDIDELDKLQKTAHQYEAEVVEAINALETSMTSLDKKAAAAPKPPGDADPKKKKKKKEEHRKEPHKPIGLKSPSFSPLYGYNLVKNTIDLLNPNTPIGPVVMHSAARRAANDSTLMRVMLSDDVLRAADPYKVQSIYESLASIAPTASGDPNLVAPILKEAIQYDAIPLNILTTLADFEDKLVKTEETRGKINIPKLNIY